MKQKYHGCKQFSLPPQLPLQELGVADGLGVPVGVALDVAVGLGLADSVAVTVKVNEQPSAAFGILEGTFGATGCSRS